MVTKLEKLKSALHAAKEAYKLESEERQRLDAENERLSGLVEQMRLQRDQAHQESWQTSRQLHECKSVRDGAIADGKHYERLIDRIGDIVKQHLIVCLDLPTTKPDCEVCETSRLMYLLLDTIHGK